MKPKTKSFRKNKKRLSKKARKTKKMVGGLTLFFYMLVLVTIIAVYAHIKHHMNVQYNFEESIKIIQRQLDSNNINFFESLMQTMKSDTHFARGVLVKGVPLLIEDKSSLAETASDLGGHTIFTESKKMPAIYEFENFKEYVRTLNPKIRAIRVRELESSINVFLEKNKLTEVGFKPTTMDKYFEAMIALFKSLSVENSK